MITAYVIQGKNGFLHVCGVHVILIQRKKKKMGQLSQNARQKKWISTDYF